MMHCTSLLESTLTFSVIWAQVTCSLDQTSQANEFWPPMTLSLVCRFCFFGLLLVGSYHCQQGSYNSYSLGIALTKLSSHHNLAIFELTLITFTCSFFYASYTSPLGTKCDLLPATSSSRYQCNKKINFNILLVGGHNVVTDKYICWDGETERLRLKPPARN